MSVLNDAWNMWDKSLLSDDYALKRIASAKKKALTPIEINDVDGYGYFQGSHGKYETFLDRCPCGDFHRAKRPCKHMFRLAMELGLMEGEFESDLMAIRPVRNQQMPLSDMIDIVESLPDSTQKALLKAIRDLTNDNPMKRVKMSPEIDTLVKSGLLEIVPVDNVVVKCKCSDNCNRLKLHRYLHRKYDSEAIFNVDGSVSYVPCLNMNLPDDDVTSELVKRGYVKGDNNTVTISIHI